MTKILKLLIGTNNKGKLKEIRDLLPKYIKTYSTADYNLKSPREDGLTFEENSLIKSKYFSKKSKLICLADDSGLEIDILNKDPGIYSARYAGEGASDLDNRNKIIEELNKLNLKSLPAYYVCVLVGVHSADDPMPIFSSGEIHGDISTEASGEGGFGYDKLFYPYGYNISMATMDPNEKNRISHRAIATNIFLEKLENIRAK